MIYIYTAQEQKNDPYRILQNVRLASEAWMIYVDGKTMKKTKCIKTGQTGEIRFKDEYPEMFL